MAPSAAPRGGSPGYKSQHTLDTRSIAMVTLEATYSEHRWLLSEVCVYSVILVISSILSNLSLVGWRHRTLFEPVLKGSCEEPIGAWFLHPFVFRDEGECYYS